MKKIATITFHASYNYGSNLQAYALQEYVKKICNYDCEYEIINLRTDIQKEVYELPFGKMGIKNIIKSMLLAKFKHKLEIKQTNFEKFINKKLNLTKEFTSLEELKKQKFDYDYYVSGSDQIWNLAPEDFDWSYYLEFVNKGTKISYATSFGPKVQNWSEEEKNRIKKDLEKFKYISVREKGSYDNVYQLLGIKPSINVDPTLLLMKKEWEKLIDKKKFIDKEYILLYDLKDSILVYKLAKKLSKKLKIPVIVTKPNIYDLVYNFEKYYECGPLEFLNLVKNAKVVLTTSFHGTVFSILFNKPFFVVNGDIDFRIDTLLKKTSLEERNINDKNFNEGLEKVFNINFKKVEKVLKEETKKTESYLKMALEIDE